MGKDKDGVFFGLDCDPFGKDTGREQFFKHSQLEQLDSRLKTGITQKVSMAVTGPPGVGKTTAVRYVTDELPAHKYSVIYLGHDQSGANLLKRLAVALGMQPKRYRAHLALQISQWLLDNLSTGGKEVIVVVDEAHLLDNSTLEEFRLMTNADYDRQSPVVLLLLGQPAFRMRLKLPEFEALSQRLRYRYSLEGLDQDETITYLRTRLEAAGLSADLFSQDALHLVFQLSEGVLRQINNLASLCLLEVRSQKLSSIDAALVRHVSETQDLYR